MLLGLALMSCQDNATMTANYQVVPLPQEITETGGEGFLLTSATSIVYNGDETMKRNAEHLSAYIKEATGLELEVTNAEKESAITLAVEEISENSEVKPVSSTVFTSIEQSSCTYPVRLFRSPAL